MYAAAARVTAALGPVTILFNNAGIVTGKRLLESPDALLEKTMQVNVLAHFWTLKAFLPGTAGGPTREELASPAPPFLRQTCWPRIMGT